MGGSIAPILCDTSTIVYTAERTYMGWCYVVYVSETSNSNHFTRLVLWYWAEGVVQRIEVISRRDPR